MLTWCRTAAVAALVQIGSPASAAKTAHVRTRPFRKQARNGCRNLCPCTEVVQLQSHLLPMTDENIHAHLLRARTFFNQKTGLDKRSEFTFAHCDQKQRRFTLSRKRAKSNHKKMSACASTLMKNSGNSDEQCLKPCFFLCPCCPCKKNANQGRRNGI